MFFLKNLQYYFDLFYNYRKRRIYREIVTHDSPVTQVALSLKMKQGRQDNILT